MFLSRLNDIMEPRGRIQKDSWIFKKFKVSYQKIEVLALIADLFLIAVSSTFGGAVYRYIWHDNFATTDICLSVGLINGFFYVYAVSMRGLYCLPVLLMPLPNVSLLAIFASTTFLVTGSVFILNGNIASAFWPLVTTLLLQIILLLIVRGVFAIATRTLLSVGSLDGRRVVTIGEPAELMGLSASFLLQCFGRKEVFRVPVAMNRGCRSSEVLANLDGAITRAYPY